MLLSRVQAFALQRGTVYYLLVGCYLLPDIQLGVRKNAVFGGNVLDSVVHLLEAYGRDMRINEGGHFAPTGYLTRSGDFKEVYHGIEDIPAEHRIFAYPKLNIREQMAAYKEVIDRSSLEGERLHPRKEHDDR